LRKYLSFDFRDTSTDTAKAMLNEVVWRKTRNRFLVDSLMTAASHSLSQEEPQVLRAALLYKRVLEIESDNQLAATQLSVMQPAIDDFVSDAINAGIEDLKAGRFTEAETSFRRAEIFEPDNEMIKIYLTRVTDGLKEDAMEFYFRGVGYYGQKEYISALEAFNRALELHPELSEANDYKYRTQEKLAEIEQKTDALLRDAFLFEEQKRYVRATNLYLEILELAPRNEIARSRLTALRPQVEKFVAEKYRLGVEAANVGDYPVAITHFKNVLAIDSGHSDARIGLRQAQSDLKVLVNTELLQARIAEDKGNWGQAVESYSYVMELSPGNTSATEGHRRVVRFQKLDMKLKSAGQKFMLGEYHNAKVEVESVLASEPEYLPAKELHEKIEEEIRTRAENLFNKGLGFYAEDEYQQAITYWEQVLALVPDHTLAIDYIKQANERISALKQIE